MIRTIIIFLCVVVIIKASAKPSDVYTRITANHYFKLILNTETNKIDTIHLIFDDNHEFRIIQVGEESKIIIVGNWNSTGKNVVLKNRYPYDIPLSVRVLPVINCKGLFPDLTDSSGKVTYDFYMNASNNTYNSGMIIPYKELDTLKNEVRICSNDGNYCSCFFAIQYTDCYRIIVDMSVNPNQYNGSIKTLYFRKYKSTLKLIKSDISK